MFGKCHVKTLGRALAAAALFNCFGHAVPSRSLNKAKVAQKDQGSISFDELDVQEKGNEERALEPEQEMVQEKPQRRAQRTPLLPTAAELVEAKISALKSKLFEQEVALAKAKIELDKEQQVEKTVFDNSAYLSVSITNSAPFEEYRLDSTQIFIDGKRIARGGIHNKGLPRVHEVFFSAVEPGCHEVKVIAIYTRLKNDIISRLEVNRVEKIVKTQTVLAENGYRAEIAIEGFEQHNTFFDLDRGPSLRFNKSRRVNFLPGAPIVSMDDVLKEGRVHIDYFTEDTSQHRLIEKSISIDGLPILDKEKHDQAKEKDVIFDRPLAGGKHTLGVTLLFGEQKWVTGGPMYNFRLKFDRDFYVISGQTTRINLTGMPKGGFRSAAEDSRYARSSMKILSEQHQESFPEESCKVIKAREEALKKAAQVKAKEEEKKAGVQEAVPASTEEVKGTQDKAEEPSVSPPENKEEGKTEPAPVSLLENSGETQVKSEPGDAFETQTSVPVVDNSGSSTSAAMNSAEEPSVITVVEE
jgi:hypothetical protein